MVVATPHNAEAVVKRRIAASRNGLRPKMSPSRPNIGIVIIDASMYDVATHAYRPKPLSWPTICGSAVLTIVWSRATSIAANATPSIASSDLRNGSNCLRGS